MLNFKRSIRILTQSDLLQAGCFNMKKAISVCEDALKSYVSGNILFPDKVAMILDEDSQSRINCLPAGLTDKSVYGMKWVSVFPENPHTHQIPNQSAVILLSETNTGFPIAFMEGILCSNLRTAAMGAIGAKYLARKDSKTIGFIGAGELAKTHLLSMMTIFPNLEICKVSSRTIDSETLFIQQMKEFFPDLKFEACKSNYEMAVKDADIIVTAISGQEKILKAEWIKEGAYYCHVGGLEDDYSVALKANKIVCDDWNVVKHRTQTISRMYQEGILSDNDIHANLCEIVVGQKSGRESPVEFNYFNSVGLSYIDIALANWMYETAVMQGFGSEILMQEKSMFDTVKNI